MEGFRLAYFVAKCHDTCDISRGLAVFVEEFR